MLSLRTRRRTAPVAALLSRRQALPLAVGSVAGSGILFLPSAVYVAAGRDSTWVWATAALLCVPMLLMFEDIVHSAPPGQGMEWLVRTGLGDRAGRCVPVLFLAVVVLGLPAGALVAGACVRSALGSGPGTTTSVGGAVLLAAVLANLAGARASARLQLAATGLLVAVVVVLAALALSRADGATASGVMPGPLHPAVALPAVVLAFWAFAGFENLTFLSGELRHPTRDLLPVCVTALAVYGALTVALTVAVAVTVPRRHVDAVTGLVQVAERMPFGTLPVIAVLLAAVCAMVMNAVAWTWGVSRVAARAAQDGLLPRALAVVGAGGTPSRAVLLLGALFTLTGSAMAARPALVVPAVGAAGSVFLLLYGLCIVAYLRVRGASRRSLANLLPLAVIVASVTQAGRQSLYGPLVAATTALAYAVNDRRRHHQEKEQTTTSA